MTNENHVLSGTMGGSLCSIWANYAIGDFVHTLLMAIIGTVVSYLVSDYLGRKNNRE